MFEISHVLIADFMSMVSVCADLNYSWDITYFTSAERFTITKLWLVYDKLLIFSRIFIALIEVNLPFQSVLLFQFSAISFWPPIVVINFYNKYVVTNAFLKDLEMFFFVFHIARVFKKIIEDLSINLYDYKSKNKRNLEASHVWNVNAWQIFC